jgi:hypothetical protein
VWDFLQLPEFWAATGGFGTLLYEMKRSHRKTRDEVRDEVRELRRMMVRHLEDHPKPTRDNRFPWVG